MATISQSTADILQIAPLHQFRTADYLEMIEKGVLGSRDRVELMGGMIVEMSPQGTRHNHFLMQLKRIFAPLWDQAIIAIQATAAISERDVYDPDLLLLKPNPEQYKVRHPGPQDILLVLEAAESSLRRDQEVKLPVYSAAGIPEYWIADLRQEILIIHRDPDGATYRSIETRRGDDIVSPSAALELSFAVRKIFE